MVSVFFSTTLSLRQRWMPPEMMPFEWNVANSTTRNKWNNRLLFWVMLNINIHTHMDCSPDSLGWQHTVNVIETAECISSVPLPLSPSLPHLMHFKFFGISNLILPFLEEILLSRFSCVIKMQILFSSFLGSVLMCSLLLYSLGKVSLFEKFRFKDFPGNFIKISEAQQWPLLSTFSYIIQATDWAQTQESNQNPSHRHHMASVGPSNILVPHSCRTSCLHFTIRICNAKLKQIERNTHSHAHILTQTITAQRKKKTRRKI